MQRKFSGLFTTIVLLAFLAACGPSDGAPATTTRQPQPLDGVIVDDQDPGMELNGIWREVDVDGAYGEHCVWAPLNPTVPNEFGYTMYDSSLAAYAYVRPELPQAGTYEIFAHWCAPPEAMSGGQQLATLSEIEVHPTRGRVAYVPVQANMAQAGGGWHSLGRFYLEEDGSLIVSNAEGDNNGAVVVDAFRFVFRTAEREATRSFGPPVTPPQPSATP